MTQTITIDINSQLLANAQLYSKRMGSDLSHFIELLLYQVLPNDSKTQDSKSAIKTIDQLSPFVQSLCGVVKNTPELDMDIDGEDARVPCNMQQQNLCQ